MNQGLKVLIADDSDHMRIVVKGFLKKFLANHQIFETKNLSDTFDLLNRENFDFLLLDINMPEANSNPETVKEILTLQGKLKICMFSGNDKTALEQAYKDAGAIGFIQKDGNISNSLQEVLTNNF